MKEIEKEIEKIPGNVTFTKEEAQVLINLMNEAVKAKGLEVAESALYLTNKIDSSFK